MNFLKKLIPFQKSIAQEKPLHAGEIYYLWEGLTSGYKLIEVVETYLMNTEDTEVHALLTGIIKGTDMMRIQKLEKILKEERFTVPPRPASKTHQGKPEIGQEVKLTDDEVIVNLVTWAQVLLQYDVKAVGACTSESVRKVFTDMIFDEIKAYNLLIEFGKMRNVFIPPPLATAKDNSLNMEEVSYLWGELTARHISLANMEIYLINTKDQELIKFLKRGIKDIILPQIEELENILKSEGFTVTPRPQRRMVQGPPGQINKIKLSDEEVIGVLSVAFQIAIDYHIRGYISSMRNDIRSFFEDILSTEIEEYQKLINMAINRHALSNPPIVSSYQR